MSISKEIILEDRIIIFIDILGFRDLLKNIDQNSKKAILIRDILKGFGKTKNSIKNNLLRPTNFQMTSFSDSIVISAPNTSFNNDTHIDLSWAYLKTAVSDLLLSLLYEGLVCRGAITSGLAYHHEEIVFGPGIVDAYLLEKDVACYPRIIVSEELLQKLGDDSLMQDNDGWWSLDYLLIGQPNQGTICSVGEKIEELLKFEISRSPKRPKVLTKYRWLANYFNRCIKKDIYQINVY